VRSRGGLVVFVLHDGAVGEDLEPLSAGWQVLKSIETQPEDRTIRKKLNDSFRGTDLASVLKEHGAQRVIVSGWASDLCVEATVWSAIERGFEVVVAADCHTVSDRPHLSAGQVIAHHNWLWSNLISTTPVRVLLEREI
jgi:nicotinamidase-related amidase